MVSNPSYGLDSRCLVEKLRSATNESSEEVETALKSTQKQASKVRAHAKTEKYALDKETVRVAYSKNRLDAPIVNFETHLKSMIADLPPEQAKAVEDIVENSYEIIPSRDGAIRGTFLYRDKKIRIILPEELIGTDVEYFIKIHETYHVLNNISSMQGLSKTTKVILKKVKDKIKHRYLEEAGAMAQEWQYLNTIPSNVKIKILKEIEEHVSNKHDREFLTRIFTSNAQNPAEHILAEQAAGRYSQWRTGIAMRSYDINMAVNLTTIGAAAGGFIYLAPEILASKHRLCEQLDREKKKNAVVYKYLCEKNTKP